jgi:magnesium-protoporphyrin O-methyltransferase
MPAITAERHMSCEQCSGITRAFDDKAARKVLRRFRRRGPDRTTRLLIGALRRAITDEALSGLTMLDVGAGIGALHHDLLNGLVRRATHIDASAAHLAAAREETARRGHQSVVDFHEGDFTTMADGIPSADIVTLDRVICCFDDMERLVRLSSARCMRFYGAVFPRDVHWMRLAIGVINLVQRVQRSQFRVFLHDPHAIDSVLQSAGLRVRVEQQTLGWKVVLYERVA